MKPNVLYLGIGDELTSLSCATMALELQPTHTHFLLRSAANQAHAPTNLNFSPR